MKKISVLGCVAAIFLSANLSNLDAQTKTELTSNNSIAFTYQYGPTQYDSDGRETQYGWIMNPVLDQMTHKWINAQNTKGSDPNVPIVELPAGMNNVLRLGTMTYNVETDQDCNVVSTDFARGGGAVFKYQVTPANAILYISYAMMMTDSKPDHITALTSLIGQYAWNDGLQDYWVGDASIYHYDGDALYQQPYAHFFLAVDGQPLSCADHHIMMYDQNGNSVALSSAWKTRQFTINDNSSGCAVSYNYDARYKDWSVMAVDLTPYIGHLVAFTAEYYDCAQAGWYYLMDGSYNVYSEPNIYTCDDHHLARLYLNVAYSANGDGVTYPTALTQVEENCLNNQVTYSAPEGFASYRWYSSVNPSVTLSSSSTCTYTFAGGDNEFVLNCAVTSTMTQNCTPSETVFSIPVKNNCNCQSTFTFPDFVCADGQYIEINFEYTAGAPVSYDVTFNDEALMRGFNNLIDQPIPYGNHLLIPMPVATGTQYVRPDQYLMTLRVHQSNGKDTVMTRVIEVRYPSWLVQQRWDDVMALYNQNYNGGYYFSAIQWYQAGMPIATGSPYQSYIYQPGGLNTEADYWAALTRMDDGKTFCTCPLRPTPYIQDAPEKKSVIDLSATQYDRRRVTVTTDHSGQYIVYSPAGQALISGYFGERYGSPDIQLPAAGSFILRFFAEDGTEETMKWIAY